MLIPDWRKKHLQANPSATNASGGCDSIGFADDGFERTSTLPRPSTLTTEPNRILICRPNSRLGNTLLLTPLVQELERLFPGAEIDIVSACPSAAEIFREYTSVRTIHQLPRLGARQPLSTLAKFLLARRTRYDLIIDPCPKSWTSRFWTRAMRTRADKLGFRSAKKVAGVNCSVSIENAPRHMAQYPVHLIRRVVAARVAGQPQRFMPQLNLRLTKAEREFGVQKAQQLVRDYDFDRPIVGLFLNATGKKRFGENFWRRLVTRLQKDLPQMQIIEIVPASGERVFSEWPSYFSTSVRRVAAVINATDWFISADCGVMHLGAATETSTLGLFKVTDAAVYAPYGAHNAAIHVDENTPESAFEQIAQRMLTARATRRQAVA
ncbi:MAG: glycosyltransferase family 9 protein [Candidatus Obscuribacterales bacterium]|nr:glycosyltransferase family 9 protein [Steroidobacteraceae bacterium]